MKRVALFYASMSGRTRRVADSIKREIEPAATVQLFDLRESQPSDLNWADFLIFGSPTYGKGEPHFEWKKWFERILSGEISLAGKTIGLFVLGDQKHHAETFGGALIHFSAFLSKLNITPVGHTKLESTPDKPAILDRFEGMIPGLLLDEVRHRKESPAKIAAWVQSIRPLFSVSRKSACRTGPLETINC